MKGHPRTYLSLFDVPTGDQPAIASVEIPIIQRDYAQGRPDDETSGIRERFVDAIVRAATTEESMALDFVYGDVNEEGVLRPLDGQQRLTTLFLLHWYVASCADVLDPDAPWLKFSYATRPSARDFCETLVNNPYPPGQASPSEWITDQHWYVYPWRQDPTISSMLVMLDEIHDRIDHDQIDFEAVWDRLKNREERAIWFLFLPVANLSYGEDLYIKMNSRGKPLTPFEVFKADLEGILQPVLRGHPCQIAGHAHDQYDHLTTSIDGAWTDLLWGYEKTDGGDFVIDDEFMRYLRFIIDVCEWRDGHPDRRWRDREASRARPLEERAWMALVDPENSQAATNRAFFFHSFDTWVGVQPAKEFARLFTADGKGEGPLPLFASAQPDLFGSCVARYGTDGEFSLAETILLFAVLLGRQRPELGEADLDRRLRTLRNLAETATIDRKRMSDYLKATERLVVDGTLDGVQGFNAEWAADEQRKWRLMDANPSVTEALHQLEDLSVTRGRLLAFDLAPDTIPRRAAAFVSIAGAPMRDALGAALLTKGDYSRDVGWDGTRRQLGNSQNDDSWREILTTGTREMVKRTREPLMALLDDIYRRAEHDDGDSATVLEAICEEWLREREARRHYDWRYYLVRYRGARSSMGKGYLHNSGYDEARGGFAYGRITLLYGAYYSAKFSDALLRASWIEGDLGVAAVEPKWWRLSDPGMSMARSSVEIRCINEGFELVPPADNDATEAKALDAAAVFPWVDGNRVLVDQEERDGVRIDIEDRVQLCIRLVRTLSEAGL